MSILGILIPVSLFLGGVGVIAFLWTLRTDQYDDLEGHAARILQEDDLPAARSPSTKDARADSDATPSGEGDSDRS
ncbi:MAG: cbb3-type cytochrome oxidase assembly protein CcoS [Pseudomonadota bacterium]